MARDKTNVAESPSPKSAAKVQPQPITAMSVVAPAVGWLIPGAGGLYIVARALDIGRGAIDLATADYGTKYIIVSGLLNIISAVDAHDIAIGKKK